MSIYNFRPRKDEDSRIEEFLKKQSGGYGDILRYLIEKEIAENGIRDLSLIIPSKRNIDKFTSFYNSQKNKHIGGIIENVVTEDEINITEVKSMKNINESISNENNKDRSNITSKENFITEEVNNEIVEEEKEKIFTEEKKDVLKEEIKVLVEEKEEDNNDDIPICYM